jgi:hypothetical protein
MLATISIEGGNLAPLNGLVEIWWWKPKTEPNKNLRAKKPVWEIFDAHQVFLLCGAGETIEVDEDLIVNNFIEIK